MMKKGNMEVNKKSKKTARQINKTFFDNVTF